MQGSLVERAWAWLHETFPERQIYIRSDGRVQFFTFGPSLQATLAGLTLIFLGWVAFSTVNVIFKDRIIAAKDHRYQQMQSAYENRVADLQYSYDELNNALVSAEDQFKSTANELQTKQNTIQKFLDRKHQVDALVASGGNMPMIGPTIGNGPAQPESSAGSDSLDAQAPGGSDSDDDAISGGGTSLQPMPQPVAPQPRTAKSTHASLLDLGGAVGRITGILFGSKQPKPAPAAEAFARHPALAVLAQQTERVRRIGAQETVLMAQAQAEVASGVQNIRSLMGATGIDPDKFQQKYETAYGIGGPDIPLGNVHIEGIADAGFQSAYLKASAVLNQITELLGAMRHVPLTVPVSGPEFSRTSGFGARVDPFTGRYAFHPGIDFAGPWGALVRVTAPGTVVWAGPHGAYGNMVEIDHGLGIHTRYGHLSAVLVRVGTKVTKGFPVGKLGSTGRSTGPHVHYEIWYDDVVRNPSKFIEAGRHVL
ncbi:MAG TPA: peptidoglycan DD-metalloendopeptidase family protein [Rhizomicrobium sp.]|nr:peptidoglycan DD-metalloendopeptidase family protein [Rhizomicrobium sp.]